MWKFPLRCNQPRRSHEILIPTVPLAGWDVAFVAQEDPKAPAKLVWKPGGFKKNEDWAVFITKTGQLHSGNLT